MQQQQRQLNLVLRGGSSSSRALPLGPTTCRSADLGLMPFTEMEQPDTFMLECPPVGKLLRLEVQVERKGEERRRRGGGGGERKCMGREGAAMLGGNRSRGDAGRMQAGCRGDAGMKEGRSWGGERGRKVGSIVC